MFSDFETLKIVILPGFKAKSWSKGFLRFECTVTLALFFSAILIGASPQCQNTAVLSFISKSTISTRSEGLLFNWFKILQLRLPRTSASHAELILFSDPEQSYIEFEVDHLGFFPVTGRIEAFGAAVVLDENNIVRVQTAIRKDFQQGHRFAEWLGLENEGLMKKFGFDGSDQYRYARIF